MVVVRLDARVGLAIVAARNGVTPDAPERGVRATIRPVGVWSVVMLRAIDGAEARVRVVVRNDFAPVATIHHVDS